MPSEKENLCCRNHTKSHENPEFRSLVLNDKVLELSMKTNSHGLSYRFNPEENASWRYTAYRQYTMWFWGVLREKQQKSHSCLHSP